MGRGSLTVWLDEAVLSVWFEADKSGRRGASRTYSATAIEAILLLKAVYHLPLRAAQGFVQSVLALLGLTLPGLTLPGLTLPGLTLPVPHYSTLSRRQIGLELGFPVRKSQESLHLRHYIWWWTRRAARFTAKASGRCACTARAHGAHDAHWSCPHLVES